MPPKKVHYMYDADGEPLLDKNGDFMLDTVSRYYLFGRDTMCFNNDEKAIEYADKHNFTEFKPIESAGDFDYLLECVDRKNK